MLIGARLCQPTLIPFDAIRCQPLSAHADSRLSSPLTQQQVEDDAFSAADWHRSRRRRIFDAHHDEVKALATESDFWVFSFGAVLLPSFGWALWHAPDFSPAEWVLNTWGVGSLRATWAVYCGHALSHGRWSRQVGRTGSAKFNAALALTNVGHLFQVIPSYWVMHASHHSKLGTLPLLEARERAKRAMPTDGDLGIATRVFSPPARRYNIVLERTADASAEASVLPRQPEHVHQAISLGVHAIAPIAFAGYLGAALRAERTPATANVRSSLAIQAAASLVSYAAVIGVCAARDSAAPLLFYLASSIAWLCPLNPNWIWTSPHLCERKHAAGGSGSGGHRGADPVAMAGAPEDEPQPTVSFYTPPNAIGTLLDMYMGFENYHVEHHDFPEMPMYHLPKLKAIAPDMYEGLRCMPVLEADTWRDAWGGDFFYACQDTTFDVGARLGPRDDDADEHDGPAAAAARPADYAA